MNRFFTLASMGILTVWAATACEVAGQSPEVSRLSYFKGEFFGSIMIGFGGNFGISTAPLTVVQPNPSSVSFSARYEVRQSLSSSWRGECLVELRYDAKLKQYLFSFATAPDVKYSIKDLPLSSSDETGFQGTGTGAADERKWPVEVSIAIDRAKGSHVWEVKGFPDSQAGAGPEKREPYQTFRFSFGRKSDEATK